MNGVRIEGGWGRVIVRTDAMEISTMSTTEAENKEIAMECTDGLVVEGNLALIDEHFADDAVVHHSALPEPVGPEGVKESVSMFRTAFPDLEYTHEDIIAEGDKVVRRSRFTGTHEGEFMGIEPTGKEVEVQEIVIARLEDGEIVETWNQIDVMGMMQQLGLVEPPGE